MKRGSAGPFRASSSAAFLKVPSALSQSAEPSKLDMSHDNQEECKNPEKHPIKRLMRIHAYQIVNISDTIA
jgi:hypothetical protein